MLRAVLSRVAGGGKRLTFLYVPDNASVRQFMVPKVLFYALGGGVVALLALLGFFGARYLSAAADGRQALSLRGENLQLRERLEEMQTQIGSLRTEMKSSLEVQQRLRVIASLEELDPQVMEAGVGGPAPALTSVEALAPDARGDVESAGRDLAQLLRQARMQKESYSEILSALEQKRHSWDHTPSVRPLSACTITSHYGRRMDPFTGGAAMHRGVDFAARPGAPIRATANGVVTMSSRFGSYGLVVELDHGNGLVTRYAHCSSMLVQPGKRVKRGDIIARVGSTGKSSGTHVHYEVLRNGFQVDPMDYVLPTDVVVD
jgi:murein DD-endopeptidase MepM/ murein hydrolase activator NlpD